MYKAYRFRMYPNTKQKEMIHKNFGCVRFVYNYYLNKSEKDEFKGVFTYCNELKSLVKEYSFLKEVESSSLRNAIFNLEDSYKNFFAKRSKYPKYKNKYSKQSYRITCVKSTYKENNYSNIELDLKNKKIKLPKLKEVNIRGYRKTKEVKGRIINATIEYETTNKYYVSVIVEERKKIDKKVEVKKL